MRGSTTWSLSLFAPSRVLIYTHQRELLYVVTYGRPPALLSIPVVRGHLAKGNTLEVADPVWRYLPRPWSCAPSGDLTRASTVMKQCERKFPTRPNSIALETQVQCEPYFLWSVPSYFVMSWIALTIQPTERMRGVSIALSGLIFVISFEIWSDTGIIPLLPCPSHRAWCTLDADLKEIVQNLKFN